MATELKWIIKLIAKGKDNKEKLLKLSVEAERNLPVLYNTQAVMHL